MNKKFLILTGACLGLAVGLIAVLAIKEGAGHRKPASINTSIPVPADRAEFETLRRQMSTALVQIGLTLRHYVSNNPSGLILDSSGQLHPKIFTNSAALSLDRFEILVRDARQLASAMQGNPQLVIARSLTPIPFDGRYTRFYLLADGSVRATILGLADDVMKGGFLPSDNELRTMAEAQDPVRRTLLPVLQAFAAANNGQRPTDPSQLQSYIKTPEQQTVLNQEIERLKSVRKP